MLSYQHGYHAGNYADVLKHIALTRLLSYLTLKEKPLFYLETHAGKGFYDFRDRQAIKTGEYKKGIQQIWTERKKAPSLLQPYLQMINQVNLHSELRYYPGSPMIAINLLRDQDRMFFCELHPREFEELNQLDPQGKRVHFSPDDGLAALKAMLPPPEKRGLIFIDPAYEVKDEYKTIAQAVQAAYSRFATGVYCIWYPIVDRFLVNKLDRGMQAINGANRIRIEFNLNDPAMVGMTGTGLWIINPPYTFAEEMKTVCSFLKNYFNSGHATFSIEVF